MHCLYLITSPISFTQQSSNLYYHLVSHYREGHLDEYVRFRGSLQYIRNDLANHLGHIHHTPLAPITAGHSWGKLCASEIVHLQEVYNFFGGRPNREVNRKKYRSDLSDKNYVECHKTLLQAKVNRSKIYISYVIDDRFAPCTMRMLVRLVSSNHAKIVGLFSSYSHEKKAKLSLIGDVKIPAKNMLDSLTPIISSVVGGSEMHLVSVVGYLKLITRKDADMYEIMPRLGDHPDNKLYDFLADYEKYHHVAPKPSLDQAIIV